MLKRMIVICISCFFFSACTYEAEYQEAKNAYTSFLSAVQNKDKETASYYAPFLSEFSAEQLEQSFQYYNRFLDDSVLTNYKMSSPKTCIVIIRVQTEEIRMTIKKIDTKTWQILPELTISYFIDEVQL